MAKYLDYAGLSLYDRLIKELIKNNQVEVINKINDLVGGSDVDVTIADILDILDSLKDDINTKVDKRLEGDNGTAEIFNERDGGGAHFINKDGSESFVGVNDGGQDGLMAQIYADKLNGEGKWEGAKIDVTNGGIYYTVGSDSFSERAVADNEIAVKKDINDLRDIIAEITGTDSDSIASISELKNAIDANSAAIDELLGDGDESIDSRIDSKVNDAVNELVNGAPEALDTLREIVEWIGGSDADSVNIAENLAKNSEDIDTLKSDVETNKTNIADAIDAASDAYNSASSRINVLEDIVGVPGSDFDDINLIDKISNIEDRLDSFREEEDSAIEKVDIRDLFDEDTNAKVED